MSNSQKISQFNKVTSLLDSSLITVVSNGQNFTIPFLDFKASLGVTGTINAIGDPLGVPVLEQPTTTENNIRNLESGAGVNLSLSPNNGITVDTDFSIGDNAGIQVLTNEDTEPLIRSLQGVGGVSISAAGGLIQISIDDAPIASNTIVVNSLVDLPDPVGDVITLADNSVYLFSSLVDIGANRMVTGVNTSAVGSGAFATGIISSATGDLFTGVDGAKCILGDMTITATNARLFNYSYSAAGQGVLILSRLSIQGCREIGVVGNLRALLVDECGIPASENGWLFENEIKIISMATSQIVPFAGKVFDFGTSVCEAVILSNIIIETLDPSVIIFDGLTDSGNISVTGYATVSTMKVLTPFAASTTITNSDTRWLFSDCFGLPNTTNNAETYLNNNATVTTIAVAGTPVKLAGVTWQESLASRYQTDNTGRITYVGETPTRALVSVTLSALKQGGGVDTYIFKIGKNGTPSDSSAARIATSSAVELSVSAVAVFDLVKGDFIDVFVENVGGINDMLITFSTISVTSDA